MNTRLPIVHQLAEHHADPLWITDDQLSTIIYFNREASQQFHFTRPAPINTDTLLLWISPENHKTYLQLMEAIKKPSSPSLDHIALNLKSELNCTNVQLHYQKITDPMTHHQQVLFMLHRTPTASPPASININSKQLCLFLENSGYLVWIKDNALNRHIYTSPNASAILGASQSSTCINEQGLENLINQQDLPYVTAARQSMVQDASLQNRTVKYRLINQNRNPIRCTEHLLPILNGHQKQFLGIVEINHDDYRQEIKNAAYYFKYFAKENNSVFWVRDTAGQQQLYVSPAYEKIWGRSCESLYNNPDSWKDSLIDEDLNQNLMQLRVDDVNKGEVKHYSNTFRIKRPNGDIRHIKDINFPIQDNNGTVIGFAGIANDITDDVNKKLELIRLKDMAEQSNKAKDNFLAMVSHELRTPLHAILGLTQVLQNETNDPKLSQFLTHIINSSNHLNSLLNDILEFTCSSDNNFNLKNENTNIYNLIHANVTELQFTANKKNIPLTLNYKGSQDLLVKTDPIRIQQIINNLVFNAIKFTNKGQIDINVTIEEKNTNADIVLECRDSGIGIRPEDLSRIFDHFEQVNQNNSHVTGLGLGLSITKKIVESLGGNINVTSIFNEGATFTVNLTLPVASPSLQPNPAPELTPKLIPRSYSILVVEDEHINQLVISNMLDQLQQQFVIVDSGKKALHEIKKLDFDLIFMDIGLTDMTGIEATHLIRQTQHGKNTPIIALTAHAFSSDKERFLANTMNGVLTKPLNFEQLKDTLIQWCGQVD